MPENIPRKFFNAYRKLKLYKMSRPFQHKVDYEGDTDEKNRGVDDSQSDNDDFVRNLDKEQQYKKDDEYK